MTYNFRNRLKHTSNRMSEVNRACATYVGEHGQMPITVSPILIAADELNPTGNTSLLRVERQDFVVWKCSRGPAGEIGLGSNYPPRCGTDKILWNGGTFKVTDMGHDEPCYTPVDSDRDRIIVHTVQVE